MGQHRTKQTGAQGVNLGLIITPMLDMSFQILAFFIMTYHPSALEGHLPGSLTPPDKNIAKKGSEKNPEPGDPAVSVPEDELIPGLHEAITVKSKAIVKGDSFSHTEDLKPKPLLVGRLSQVYVREAVDTKGRLVAEVRVTGESGVDAKSILAEHQRKSAAAMALLTEELKKIAAQPGTGNKNDIKIEADNDLQQEYIMLVYDTCKKAGFEKIHFVPPPVLNSKFK
jgi:biopolymer transport protein ExbD